jgi:hypothetical protein
MPLKAFLVTDDYEGHSSIEFALHNVVARRTGAAALDTEFDAVSCKRAPQFDQYAPGPVPRTALLDDGWWFECSNCYRRAEQRDWDDEDDYRPMVPCVDAADRVYCCPACRAEHAARQRAREAATAALCELVYTRFPAARIAHAHVFGDRLEKAAKGEGVMASATFDLPGLKHGVEYRFGEGFFIAGGERDAFDTLYGQRSEVPHD